MSDQSSREISFHYIKSNDFRVVPASGVWGGITPNGTVSMSFYTERHPIPQSLLHEVSPDGVLGTEKGRASREGIIRDVHVSVLIDLPFAVNLRGWLDEKIVQLQTHSVDQQQDQGDG